jgi:hypothetical protein
MIAVIAKIENPAQSGMEPLVLDFGTFGNYGDFGNLVLWTKMNC